MVNLFFLSTTPFHFVIENLLAGNCPGVLRFCHNCNSKSHGVLIANPAIGGRNRDQLWWKTLECEECTAQWFICTECPNIRKHMIVFSDVRAHYSRCHDKRASKAKHIIKKSLKKSNEEPTQSNNSLQQVILDEDDSHHLQQPDNNNNNNNHIPQTNNNLLNNNGDHAMENYNVFEPYDVNEFIENPIIDPEFI
jgi:hypothetical protein